MLDGVLCVCFQVLYVLGVPNRFWPTRGRFKPPFFKLVLVCGGVHPSSEAGRGWKNHSGCLPHNGGKSASCRTVMSSQEARGPKLKTHCIKTHPMLHEDRFCSEGPTSFEKQVPYSSIAYEPCGGSSPVGNLGCWSMFFCNWIHSKRMFPFSSG